MKRRFLMVNGKIKEVLLRKGVATSAHIDTLTFTLTHDVFFEEKLDFERHPQHIVKLANELSDILYTLFGFGILEQKNGLNGYKYSFRMGTDTANYGQVAFGGKRQGQSIMVHLYGDGLTAAVDGWENRLFNWIQVFAPFTKITRCDLAHDFVQGEYTPDQALQDWLDGGFTCRQTCPNSQCVGADWNNERFGKSAPRSGKTFYVGSTSSSKMVRVYDKGCELGDPDSPWVRFELQIRNRDYVIPHDILVQAGEYLTGAYPVCEELFTQHQHDLKKAQRIKKNQEISLLHILRYASQAVSPCINLLEQLGFDDTEIKALLKGGKHKLPKRMPWGDKTDCTEAQLPYVHQAKGIAVGYSREIREFYDGLYERDQLLKQAQRRAWRDNHFLN